MPDAHKIICPECNKERVVTHGVISMVKSGKVSGMCMSCANKSKPRTATYPLELYETHIYRVWSNMKTRCTNQSATDWPRYGGRGITICEDWKSFGKFYDDMGEPSNKNLTLDRIDNNKGYSKENCRWATKIEQANNTRNIERAKKISHMGITDTIKNWAEYLGTKRTTFGARVKRGWEMDKIIKNNNL
jgi:hypothetical protein